MPPCSRRSRRSSIRDGWPEFPSCCSMASTCRLCIAAAKAAHERWHSGRARQRKLEAGHGESLAIRRHRDLLGRLPAARLPTAQSDVFNYLVSRKLRRVAITRGGSSIRFVEGETRGEISVPQIRPVDTLGAGDIFHGAFCYYACRPGVTFQRRAGCGIAGCQFLDPVSGYPVVDEALQERRSPGCPQIRLVLCKTLSRPPPA